MAKALKVFIVLILLLSGGALYLGFLLFQQREVLKGRTQESENTLAAIAKNLSSTNFNKANLIAATTNDFEKMRKEHRALVATAQNTWTDLKNTGLDLTNTLARLDETNKVLAQTQADLAQTKTELETAKTTITEKEQEIAKRDGEINQLKTAKADLEQQVKDRDDKIAKNEETIKDLKEEVKANEEDLRRVEAELAACKNPLGDPYIPEGTAGRILTVNDEWNFVILNIGTNQKLVPNGTMVVHRGDKLVGRVRIAVVNKNMSIATIERDWEQGKIQEGDFVVH